MQARDPNTQNSEQRSVGTYQCIFISPEVNIPADAKSAIPLHELPEKTNHFLLFQLIQALFNVCVLIVKSS